MISEMEPNKWCANDSESFRPGNYERLSFTSLNTDCMQQIFEYLEWQDLVNVVETCKLFNDAACDVFKRKFSGSKRVAVGCGKEKCKKSNLVIMSRLMYFKVLRNFGHTISSLHLHLVFWDFWHYVNEYCYELTEELLIYGCSFNLSDIKKTFHNVKTLKIVSCQFYEPVTLSQELFPNLKLLKLKENYFNESLVVCHMPNLSRLSFTHDMSKSNKKIINESDIINLLRVNPYLEVLHLHLLENHGHRMLTYISENFQSLRKLTLLVHNKAVLESTPTLIHFENVEEFHLLMLNEGPVSKNPFTFAKLKSFTATQCIFDEKIMLEFLDSNTSISSLDFRVESIILHQVNVTNILQNIEEFRLYYVYDLPMQKVLDIIKNNLKLKKFFIRGQIEESYQNICNAITLSGFEYKEKMEYVKPLRIAFNVLELFAKSSKNSVVRSVLELFVGSSNYASLRWHSDKSVIFKSKKSDDMMFIGSTYFDQLNERLSSTGSVDAN